MRKDILLIKNRIEESIEIKKKLLADEILIHQVNKASEIMIDCLRRGGRIYLCGNGGSASDAMHIAGELVGRFQMERRALPAMALNADVVSLTAISNDYDYDAVFERQVDGVFYATDVLVGISTSGSSENIKRAIIKAGEIGGRTIAFLGRDGGSIKEVAECPIVVPSDVTARVQEVHILIGHILCEIVEDELFG